MSANLDAPPFLMSILDRLGHSLDDECGYSTWDGYWGCMASIGHDGNHYRPAGLSPVEWWSTRSRHVAFQAHVWAAMNMTMPTAALVDKAHYD